MEDQNLRHRIEEWSVQDAKNRLSEVLRDAQVGGPQVITVRGRPTAVVLSLRDYESLKRNQGGLVEFFQNSPLRGVDLSRDQDTGRDIEF